ncbi:MAG: type II CAAX endopeptidase family protein [Angelakisella sp.]
MTREKQQALFGAAKILAIYLLVPAVLLWVAMLLVGGSSSADIPDYFFDIVSVAGYLLAIQLLAKLAKKKDIGFCKAINLHRGQLRRATLSRLFGAGLALGCAVSSLLALLPAAWTQGYEQNAIAVFSDRGILLGFAIVLLFSPLSEEIIFRGFVLRTLRTGFGSWVAILITALTFAVLHLHPIWALYALLMGVLLGWLAVRLDDLTASVMVHFGFNCFSAIPITLGVLPPENVAAVLLHSVPMLWFCLVAGAAVAALLLWYDTKNPA